MNRHFFRVIGQFMIVIGFVLVTVAVTISGELRQDVFRLLSDYPLYGWGAILVIVGAGFIYFNRR